MPLARRTLDHPTEDFAGNPSWEPTMEGNSKINEKVIDELTRMLHRLGGAEEAAFEPRREGAAPEGAGRCDLALADLSSQALEGWLLPVLMGAGARLVAENLGVELCGIFKMDKSGESLRLVAGAGWGSDLIGSATVGGGLESLCGYTVHRSEPVSVKDLRAEGRFSVSRLLRDLGALSGLSVPMTASGYTFGAMSAYAFKEREFSEGDILFMQTAANILSIAAFRRQAVVALRQAQRALFETENYLTNVIETSSDAIVSTNKEGRVVHCNTGTEKLLGYLREEVVGQPISLLFEKGERAEDVERLLRASGGSIDGIETVLKSKDGGTIPVLSSASIYYDDEGEEVGSIRFNRDLRDRNRWKEELGKVSEEIEKTQNALEQAQAEADAAGKLREANEELNRYIECLKKAQDQLIRAEKMAALGRLTAGVSHEILNPLNVINLNLHVMLHDMDVPPEVTQIAKVLNFQAQRIGKIIEGLLDYASEREPIRNRIDLNDLAERTVELVNYDLINRNITIVQGFDRKLPAVWADHNQIQQVLLNLLTNARHAMNDGGQLTLSTGVVQKNGQDFVELRIEDTGVGIAPENMEKIFDPFFTTKPEGEGAGLGLSICQGIVEAHRGEIRAENGDGGGATFIVHLPLDSPGENPSA